MNKCENMNKLLEAIALIESVIDSVSDKSTVNTLQDINDDLEDMAYEIKEG